VLLQDPDDLLFPVPALLHALSSRSIYERTPVFPGRVFRGHVTLIAALIAVAAIAALKGLNNKISNEFNTIGSSL
jgi:hypothetical protein